MRVATRRRSLRKREPCRFLGGRAAAIILLALFLLFVFSCQQQSESNDKKFLLLSFEDFDNLIGAKDRLAADHQKGIFSRYRGRYVRWAGEVYEIRKEVSGYFVLRIKHMAGARSFDVSVRFDATEAEKLKRLNRGEAVSYSGRLANFDPETGYYLEDGGIE